MTQIDIAAQNRVILELLKTSISGLTLTQLQQQLPFTLTTRTLQRRLESLEAAQQIAPQGNKRTRYYKAVTPASHPNPLPEHEYLLPLSEQGEALKQTIRQPLTLRHPVGYQRRFLDQYRPNETFYLPENTRHYLKQIGQTQVLAQPAGTYARQVFNRLLVDLSWNSSRLEGNTYSLLETERLLQLGQSADGKKLFETQMILNHKAAIEFLLDSNTELGFNRYTILNLHGLLSENLLADPLACGRLRFIPVGIGQTTYLPLEVPQLIEECFNQILDTAHVIQDPFEQAFFAMVHLPYLQPFEDVNKRVSRLAANIPLIRENLAPLSFIDVPERAYIDAILAVYELNRVELLRDVFVWAYQRSSARYAAVRQSLGEPDPFQMKYRDLIKQTVQYVVIEQWNKEQATKYVQEVARNQLSNGEQRRFVELVEMELMSLHEGNIARYRLRPSEYQAWKVGFV
ncbi:MAG: Fic family protein [Thiofilum sp.]|uniref:Fic family protein n=1 Tax=Thiofilum sp. TaxID=2212733 RepID=UPI0025FE9810|nr:Fic family protein [Thiofilum sp.]MBK8454221.1 Fic family protein [Thiofilum sp.]